MPEFYFDNPGDILRNWEGIWQGITFAGNFLHLGGYNFAALLLFTIIVPLALPVFYFFKRGLR